MKSNGVKCCVLVDKHNPALYKKYNISEDEILSYRQSDFALREICELLNPKLIYVNSINNPLASFVNQTNLSHRILTHSHEVYEHYSHQIRKPDWVVSERIKQTYIDQNDYAPKVQPPIITEDVFNLIDDSVKIPVSVGNEFGPLDLSRLTIGMSGQTDSRKNPKLFLEVAKIYPRLNFIWIGGQKNFFESQTNLYHVPEVSVPYSYYLLFDYFMLFSLQDPCPYVVLENLYLNNKVITFKENIYYEHNSPLLEDLYFECAGSISLESVCRVIDSLVKEKATRGSKGGTRYIRENLASFDLNFWKHWVHKSNEILGTTCD
jgi:hypothetical protein